MRHAYILMLAGFLIAWFVVVVGAVSIARFVARRMRRAATRRRIRQQHTDELAARREARLAQQRREVRQTLLELQAKARDGERRMR